MLILGDWPPRVWSKGVEMAKKVAEVVRASRAKLVVAGEGGGVIRGWWWWWWESGSQWGRGIQSALPASAMNFVH